MEETTIALSQVLPPEQTENSPVHKIENSLATFAQRNFDVIEKEYSFQQDLQNEVRARLGLSVEDGGLKNNELIALLNSNSVALNDRISKTLGPSFQLAVARQQAEIAARTAESKASVTINNNSVSDQNLRRANETVDQEVLQGAAALSQLIMAMKEATKQEKLDTNS